MKQFRDTAYYVTENGDVFRNGKKLKYQICPKGYSVTTLSIQGKPHSIRTHRLVAECYIPNPNNLPQIDHLDTNKLNNHYCNLEWVTDQENKDRAVRNNLYPKGINKTQCILTEQDIIWIRKNYIPKHKEFGVRAISRKFNISPSTISNIINYKKWKHIPQEP